MNTTSTASAGPPLDDHKTSEVPETSHLPPTAAGLHGRTGESGFTFVELIVAVLILSVGLLGLAATTGFVVQQNTLSEVATERAMARQSAIESIRARPFGTVADGSRTVGAFDLEWRVVDTGDDHKTVEVVTTGRGLRPDGDGPPVLAPDVRDTVTFHLVHIQ